MHSKEMKRVYNNSSVLHPLLSQEKAMCTQPTNIVNPPTSTPLTQESATKMDQQPYVLEPTGVSASQPTSLPSNTLLIPLDNPLSMHVYLEQQHRKDKNEIKFTFSPSVPSPWPLCVSGVVAHARLE